MPPDDAYLRPRLRPGSLGSSLQRRLILDFIDEVVPTLSGTVLDVGCGHQPYRSRLLDPPSGATTYVGLDLPPTAYSAPDLLWDGSAIGLRSGSIDIAFATEVLEHVPDPSPVLAEVHRVLRPGGRLVFTVPFLWPLHDVPNDEYRYTPFALERVLRAAGFDELEMRPMGGWDASLAQLLGLWARRRPMRRRWRVPVRWLVMPVVAALSRVDRPPQSFAEGTMFTGLAGWAVKRDPSTASP